MEVKLDDVRERLIKEIDEKISDLMGVATSELESTAKSRAITKEQYEDVVARFRSSINPLTQKKLEIISTAQNFRITLRKDHDAVKFITTV